MKKKNIYYYVLTEHHQKITSQTTFDKEICYQILANFSSSLRDNSGFVSVPAKKLQSIVYNYAPYITYLIAEKIIYIDNQYEVGKKTRGYKLREVKHSNIIKIDANNSEFIEGRIRYFNKIKNDKINLSKKDHFMEMKNNITTFFKEFPIDEIINDAQTISDVNDRMAQFILLNKIKDNNLYFKRNPTNYRLDTNLTNLAGNIKFYNPNNYTSIDISNSQPYFINLLLQYLIKSTNTTTYNNNCLPNNTFTTTSITIIPPPTFTTTIHNDSDMSCNYSIYQILNSSKYIYNTSNINENELNKFNAWTTTGKFYDNFVTTETTRAEIKDMMFCVLFSKPTSYLKEKELFNKHFPTIAAFINDFKIDNGYEQFAILLQRIEARVVLDLICPLLIAAGIFLVTVHDSWIVKDEDVERAKEIINSVFEIKPNLKLESFNELREAKIHEFKNNIRRLKFEHKKSKFINPMIVLKSNDKNRYFNLFKSSNENKLHSLMAG